MSRTLGYMGHCEKCGQERRIYYAHCDDIMQRVLLRSMHKYKGVCEHCLATYGLKETVREWYKMGCQQVLKDLDTKASGVNIDFDQVDREIRENQKNEEWHAENDWKVEQFRKAKKSNKSCHYIKK